MNLIHNGSANPNVKIKCLVLVKIYGNSPNKLFNIINENKEIKIKVLPLILLLRRILNSLWRVVDVLIQSMFHRDGINQNIGGIKRSPNIVLNQFNEKILEDGSNELNKLAITFS